jgi:hypothetical protein
LGRNGEFNPIDNIQAIESLSLIEIVIRMLKRQSCLKLIHKENFLCLWMEEFMLAIEELMEIGLTGFSINANI